jgi:hypothetical protein
LTPGQKHGREIHAFGVFGFSVMKEAGLVLTYSHGGNARGEALRSQVACQKLKKKI